ncbi:SPFH domain-containing protein [Armatimonas sp.]|uniref:SPFH domain-containing protein n=1 Tax=Armatimonas sp. TaxID=1872638 RepID=UPI003753A15D
MKFKTFALGCGGTLAAGLAIWGFIESRSAWIDAGYVGILYDASSGVQPKPLKPGRVFVGWRQRLYTFPTKLMSAKYVQDVDEGEQKTADGILITTSDNANTTFDVCVIYRINEENAIRVFNNFGPIDVETIQANHLRRAIKDVVNEIGPKYDVFELMGPKRQEFCRLATESLKKRMETNGISIDSLMLMTAAPAPETMEKITRRVNQYTEYDIAVLRRQIAEVARQTNVITAQARMTATRLTSATAKDKGLEQLQLQADEEAIEKWDGHLSEIRTGGGQTMVLDGSTLAALSKRRSAAPAPQEKGQKGQ